MNSLDGYEFVSIADKRFDEIRDIRKTFVPNIKGELVIQFLMRWGLVTGRADGEDSAGRAKFRPETVEEVVERAFAIADLTIEEMEKRGWLLHVPNNNHKGDNNNV